MQYNIMFWLIKQSPFRQKFVYQRVIPQPPQGPTDTLQLAESVIVGNILRRSILPWPARYAMFRPWRYPYWPAQADGRAGWILGRV